MVVKWGLIPACAGKTVTIGAFFLAIRAHPRVCGENLRILGLDDQLLGSSPRVRGKPDDMVEQLGAVRLIPACAGKTC